MRLLSRRSLLCMGCAFLLAGAGALAFTQAGRYLESAQQDPHKADLIVCVGGDWGARTRKAAELYRLGYATHILLTGDLRLPPVSGQPDLGTRDRYLLALGVPREAILIDTVADSSRSEAEHTRTLMTERGWRRALVVSDPPHMRRLAWLWDRSFTGSGREFRVIAAGMPAWDAQAWWKDPWSAEFVRNEYLKLAYALAAR